MVVECAVAAPPDLAPLAANAPVAAMSDRALTMAQVMGCLIAILLKFELMKVARVIVSSRPGLDGYWIQRLTSADQSIATTKPHLHPIFTLIDTLLIVEEAMISVRYRKIF